MGGGAKKSNLLLFMLPVVASFGVGATHMISQSFMVYLKYQALIDAYYYQELDKPELAAIQDDSQPETSEAAAVEKEVEAKTPATQ